MCVQETRHRQSPDWAARVASGAGWKTHWSAPPPAQAKGTPRQGGAAVFWRTSGRSQAFLCPLPAAQAHRVFDGFSVVSFYGNAQFAEPSVLFQVLQTARAFGRPCLVIGDFNWKPAYQCALDASGAVMLPFTASVQGSLVSPCRGLCVEGEFRDATCCSSSLPGVPHHKAVCFSGSWTPAVCEQHSHRFRRCAEYVWHGQTCSPEHQAHFERLCAPPVLHDSPLSKRFLAWHGKAEAVCKAATRFGLAQVARKAERAKGSPATTRPVAPAKRGCELETVALRRWRRLHRSAAEQERLAGPQAPLTSCQWRHWAFAGISPSSPFPVCQGEAVAIANAAIAQEETKLRQARQARWRRQFWLSASSRSGIP